MNYSRELSRAADALEETGGLTEAQCSQPVIEVVAPLIGHATVAETVAALRAAAEGP